MEYNGYCVRVQAHEGYGDKIRMLPANADYTSIVAMRHKGTSGENAHYHLVVATQVRDQAFRVRLKKLFTEGSGNQHMSIKTWDGNIDAISYLFHEDPTGPLFLQHNVSDETIAKARARNNEVQTKVAAAKERASWRIEEEVLSFYRENHLMPDQYKIARDIVLYACRHDKYVPNDFLLKAMVNKIQFKLLDGNLKDEEAFAADYVVAVYRLDYDESRRIRENLVAEGGGGVPAVKIQK